MATKALAIKDGNDLYAQIVHYLSDETFFEQKKFKFPDELKKISIHFTGSAFNSSIPAGVMRGLLELQDAIYASYSYHAYGEKRRLSADERKALEIDVIVKEGSSWYDIPLETISKAMAERIKKLTGKEIIGIAAAVCVTFLAATLGSKYIDHKAEIAKMQELRATVTETQKNTVDAMIEAMEAQQSFYRITSSQSFESLEINGGTLTQEELKEMVKSPRIKHLVEEKIYPGDYRITDIHFEREAIYLDVVNIISGKAIRHVNILAEIISEDDFQWFKDSTNGQEIQMTIVATEKNGETISAFLQSFKK